MTNDNWVMEFAKRRNRATVPKYDSRESRNRWAATIVKTYPGTRILNVGGGGKRHLQKHLGPAHIVHELDIVGDCDTTLNLDQTNRLPFEDESFDTCCAFEVLEHLENFHLISEEMYRVCASRLLISLPNSATEIMSIVHNIKTYSDSLEHGVYTKFSGLPIKTPTDRHRWWLTFEDIVRYFIKFEEAHSCAVTFFIPNDYPGLKRRLFRALAGERLYLTLFCNSVWIEIRK